MADKVKAQLFQSMMTTKGEKGTGLGLMIVERTVRALKGKIDFDSKQGQGTTFRFTFRKMILSAE